MGSTADRLREKDGRGELEVEDLLQSAQYPASELAAEIDVLATELGWQFGATLPDIPWREWAHVVAEYCRGGYPRLIEVARDDRLLHFVAGLLDELGGDDALKCLVQAAERLIDQPERNAAVARQVATSLNLLCVRKPAADPAVVDRDKVRLFLHRLLAMARSDAERGTVLCALRYFGDASSLPLIESVPALAPQWEGTRAAARTAIAKKAPHARP